MQCGGEVDTLRKLRGSLNVASLEDVYEDQTHVHIITELCAGGELVHRIGNKHYSERTVNPLALSLLHSKLLHVCLNMLASGFGLLRHGE